MKKLPIGYESFEEIISGNFYYVDKTGLIKELLDRGGKVNLFTRPRRFGKTLNLSMLKYFFQIGMNLLGEPADYASLFDGLYISSFGEQYMKYQGQYPVISLTLKSAEQSDFKTAYALLRRQIAKEFFRHRYVLENERLRAKEESYWELMQEKADLDSYVDSIAFLSECLYRYHGKKVIILIDEYDVPLESSYFGGFYKEMVGFIRSLFESGLKTNEYLEKAVLTGCLRISRESVFTGMNNLTINSILSTNYGEYFGFTEAEVSAMCKEYLMPEKEPDFQRWYNGYIFGEVNVYNPWSVILQLDRYLDDKNAFPISHWANTSSNSIVRSMIERADRAAKDEIEAVIRGETVEKPVHEDITYDEIYESMDNLWNFMFFTGYFKKVDMRMEEPQRYVTMALPNMEVRYIFEEKIKRWFLKDVVGKCDRNILFHAIASGNAEVVGEEIERLLKPAISYHDFYEQFYHGFLTGILTGMGDYVVKSNRESGNGRSDLYLRPLTSREKAYFFEFKVAKKRDELSEKAEEALTQIEEKQYDRALTEDVFHLLVHYGISFCGKECCVCVKDVGWI
ncbi:MAG: AAA family ATPase [Lachnospiraceae bacterium]|nr:AAA family ATPase [Lachnospiraceae bacterium]